VQHVPYNVKDYYFNLPVASPSALVGGGSFVGCRYGRIFRRRYEPIQALDFAMLTEAKTKEIRVTDSRHERDGAIRYETLNLYYGYNIHATKTTL